MKRLLAWLVILLSFILIAHAQSERAGLPKTAAPSAQKEISAKLDELDTRVAALQTNLDWSNALLKKGGQRR